MNQWRSLAISAGGHLAILVLSVIIGLFAHQRSMKLEPIRVDLLPGPIGDNSDKKGATPVEKKEEPKIKEKEKPKEIKKEEKKEIITKPKEVQKPATDLNADIKKLEEFLKKNKLQEVKTPPENVTKSPAGSGYGKSGVYGSGSAYESTIQQIIRNHWMQPGRAIVGQNPPFVLVTIIVDRNGNIISRRITKSSGIAQLDESALRAIDDSNPLPKLPSYITGSQKDFELRFIVED